MFTQKEIDDLIEEALKESCKKFCDKKYEAVVVILEQVLKINSNNHSALQLLATAYHALKRNDDAKEYFNKCLAIEPDNPETLNNIALSHSNSREYNKSIEILKKAIQLKPDSPSLHANLGLQYRHLEDCENAIKQFKLALEIKESPTTLAMLGGCYGELKELDLAEECIRKALHIDPDFAAAHIDLASILQLKGQWIEGFKEYEWRFNVFEQLEMWKRIYSPEKKWDGRNISGKKLIVHTEQGNGDTLQFSRYLKILKDMGIHVTFHCSDVLDELFKGFADEIFCLDPLKIPSWKDRKILEIVPQHDFHCSVLSLPHLLNHPPIPQTPYIFAKESVDMSKYDGYFKIGIAWAGNPQHPNDKHRSCHLKFFREIYNLPNVKLFSLMKDIRPRSYDGSAVIDLHEDTDDMKIIDMAPMMNSYSDTASIINSLDLIVSVDTSIIHLAGAMNKPTISLLAWNPDWRWMLEGEKTAWYPSMKLIRQTKKGIWKDVFESALTEVKKLSA
jgi:Tfp pilus assembly protein PilF